MQKMKPGMRLLHKMHLEDCHTGYTWATDLPLSFLVDTPETEKYTIFCAYNKNTFAQTHS